MGKVVCLVYMVAFLVGFLGGSVMNVGIAWVVDKKRATTGFRFKVMLGGYLCVSGTWKLQLYCGTTLQLA